MTFCEEAGEKDFERWKFGSLEFGVAIEDVNLFLDFASTRIEDLQEMIKNTEKELNNDNDEFLEKKISYSKLEMDKIKKRLGELYFLL